MGESKTQLATFKKRTQLNRTLLNLCMKQKINFWQKFINVDENLDGYFFLHKLNHENQTSDWEKISLRWRVSKFTRTASYIVRDATDITEDNKKKDHRNEMVSKKSSQQLEQALDWLDERVFGDSNYDGQQRLREALPEQEDVGGHGEVPLRVDDDDPVLGEGEVRVAPPAEEILKNSHSFS